MWTLLLTAQYSMEKTLVELVYAEQIRLVVDHLDGLHGVEVD